MLKHPGLTGTLCVLCGLASMSWANAQTSVKQAAGDIKAAGAANVVEPESLAALEAMNAYVAGQKSFGLKTTFSVDLTLDNGQTVEFDGTANYLARRPDRLKVELVSDLGIRSFLFDGHSLFVVSPTDAVYGQLDEVGPTIKEMLEAVAYHADLELPLADLFDAGTDDALQHAVTEGFLVGPSTVDGAAAKHWAYRTAERNFQVWIAAGDDPMPLKFVIEDTTDPTRPRFEAALQWQPEAAVADADFTFVPPEQAVAIPILLHETEGEQK